MSSTPTNIVEIDGHRVFIRRHATARHVRLAVDVRRGGLRLTLPKRAALGPALRWAKEQLGWATEAASRQPGPAPIVPGMTLVVNDVALVIDWDVTYPRIPQPVGTTLCVGGPRAAMAARVLRWLKNEALRVLTADTHEIAARAGVPVSGVGVGDPRTRWGSCAANGNIRYSWRLILAPKHVRRATVAHEVAHRVHMNHGAAFHAVVAQLHDGDVAAARAWLRAHGAELHRISASAENS